MSEREVDASAFHRQAAIHSSGSSQPIGSQRGRARVQPATKNVSAIDLFPGWPILSSHTTSFFPFPAIYTVPSSLPPYSSWLYLVWRVWWGGRVRRGCSLTLNKPRRPHKCTEGLLPNKNTLFLISLNAKHTQRQREQEILITGTQFLFCGCD